MKIFKYNIFGFIFAIIFCSCESWLDVDLVDQVTEEELFSTKNGYYDALAGTYNKMSSSSLYGKTLSFEILEILAQTYKYTDLEKDYPNIRNYEYENKDVKSMISNIWSSGYSVISSVNNIIRYAETSDILNKNDKNKIIGESIAIRAFMHFDLIRMFCPDVKLSPKEEGIPYNKQFGVKIAPTYTVEECVELVKEDLLEAEKLLAESDKILDIIPYELGYAEGTTEIINKNEADKCVARMNYYAIKAMLARVYLAKGDNKKAREYAIEVINSAKFRLLDRKICIEIAQEKMDMLFSDEHIFSLRNKQITKNSKSLHNQQTTESSSKDAKLVPVIMYNVYDCAAEDVRYDKWFDNGLMRKYTYTSPDYFYPKVPIIKLSEMYLITAEAYWNIDREKAMKYLNDLRESRIQGYSKWNYASKEDLIREYRREFIGEGQMFFVYKRLNQDIIRDSGEGNIAASNNVFVFPMPDSEIENGHR